MALRDRSRTAAQSLRVELQLFRRLFEYTRPYRGRLLLSWLATAGYAVAGSLILLQVKPVFDKALALGVDVGRLSLTILVLYVFKGACSYFSTTLVADAGQRAVTDLRNRLYQHILNQSFAFLGRSTTGSLMSHITTDVEKIQAAVSELAGDLLKEGLTVLGFLCVLFYLDWRLATLSLVGLPVVLHLLLRLGQRLRASNETSLRRWKDISEILQETISGFRVVKAFGMEGFEIARFRRAAARLLSVNMRITRTTAILPPLMEAFGGLAFVAALFYGSYSIRAAPHHRRRLRRVPHRPLRDVHADQAAVAGERHAAGGAGGRAPGARGAGPARRGPRGDARRRAAAHAAGHRVPAGGLPLRGRPRGDPARRQLLPRGRARRWRSWAPAARARRRSSTCCRASTT